MNSRPAALVVVLSQAHNDPRVRRQITWLTGDGWQVDTIGLGPLPSTEVRDHFELRDQSRWVRSKFGTLITYGVLPRTTMFRRLVGDRIPDEAKRRIASGAYDLIVFDDLDFIGLTRDSKVFTPRAGGTHIHLDLHEYHEASQGRTRWQRLTARYYRQQRELIGHPRINTRSTVSGQIADFYAEEFGVERPALVRNSPPFHDQRPTPVRPDEVKLVFHGLASWARGFEQILDALRSLDSRFTMTFMLTGNPGNIERLRAAAADLGDRVRIVPPVPMTDLPSAINAYDLEIMFYPPKHRNVEFALPNKFFEAIQGRLGIIVGESPMMAELVREHDLGLVVRGWEGADLAQAIGGLTQEQIERFKLNADRAARELNAESEGDVFLNVIAGARKRLE